jgi:hypothetical protein
MNGCTDPRLFLRSPKLGHAAQRVARMSLVWDGISAAFGKSEITGAQTTSIVSI